MRTISNHRPQHLPKSDTQSFCSYCGVSYYRSQLRRDRAGLLACKADYGGDVVTLSEENAAAAQRYPGVNTNPDPGGFDFDESETPPTKTYPDGVPPITG